LTPPVLCACHAADESKSSTVQTWSVKPKAVAGVLGVVGAFNVAFLCNARLGRQKLWKATAGATAWPVDERKPNENISQHG
jgi:hypothetical protein